MSLVEKVIDLAIQIGNDIKSVLQSASDMKDLIEDNYSTVRSNIDSNGIFTKITHIRPDDTTYKISELSGGTSPEYTTRTVTFHDKDGTTVLYTRVYTLSYTNGLLSSEIIN